MNEIPNLWEDSREDDYVTTENIKKICHAQINNLKKNTGDKIKGTFARVNNPYAAMTKVAKTLASSEKLEDSESSAVKDANDLYDDPVYGFEIFNQTYRFRIFDIRLAPVYPVKIHLDEGVQNDIEDEIYEYKNQDRIYGYSANNDDEFIEILKAALNSKKVKYIRDQLLKEC